MQRRALGRTGVSVSRLAFGTMTFGGEADEAMSAKLFAACRDAGIDHFDTANVYTGGRSEEILGRLMAAERDELVIASKAFFPTADTPNARGRFAALAKEWGVHPVSAAIAWVADHPGVTAPLLGARNLEQLAPALAASELTLSVEQRQALDLLTPTPPPATDRDEERAGL